MRRGLDSFEDSLHNDVAVARHRGAGRGTVPGTPKSR